MSSVTNGTAFVSGGSQDLAHASAQGLATEFAHVIFLGDSATVGCRAGSATTGLDTTLLRLDTNGRPLRDWDD